MRLDVGQQVGPLRERLAACVTLVRPLAGVSARVNAQVAAGGKTLIARLAFERTKRAVLSSHMPVQNCSRRKSVVAKRANLRRGSFLFRT